MQTPAAAESCGTRFNFKAQAAQRRIFDCFLSRGFSVSDRHNNPSVYRYDLDDATAQERLYSAVNLKACHKDSHCAEGYAARSEESPWSEAAALILTGRNEYDDHKTCSQVEQKNRGFMAVIESAVEAVRKGVYGILQSFKPYEVSAPKRRYRFDKDHGHEYDHNLHRAKDRRPNRRSKHPG
jgi:hypothetical protein